jgi:hypothetical protein
MHTEQRAFCERVKNLFPGKFINQDVLEIGSQNINGSIRELFTGGKYLVSNGWEQMLTSCVERILPRYPI